MAEDIHQSEGSHSFESDPDYGLPEVSLTPIERGGMGRRKGTVRSAGNSNNLERKSKAPLIVTLLFVFLVILAAFWYFIGQDLFDSGQVSQQNEQVDDTPTDDQNNANVDNDLGAGDTGTDPDDSDLGDDNTNDAETGQDNFEVDDQPIDTGISGETTTRGTLTTINAPTGRTYVIIGSFFDEDLARDYGAKLGREGVSTTLIMPSSNKKFYRLSVEDFGSISEAVNSLDGLKATYGNSLWVIKY
ncbi:SPOR domain-containing protein [Fulvivirgaceae bacterium BMA12]|uniref:SPOR domain-containing protein n=1 Tax=Agaribacillus aureus TaxID=3051825 RepID=A0ABT8L752_9BACT|nr:SPOR domain-containing protein [Fulvivirgaceae bacterium BMA12]